MKKIIGVIVVVVVIFIAVGFLGKGLPKQNEQVNPFLENNNEVAVDERLSYVGKVIPEETYYYTRSAVNEFNKLYVEEGQTVSKGALLFDYEGSAQSGLQIDVLDKNYVKYQEKLNDYYTRLENLKGDLKNADKNDTIYTNYLNVEINNMEQMIAQVLLDQKNNEEQIQKLKEGKSDTMVFADIDGLIYQINDPKNTTGMATAYIVLYSSNKQLRLSVSEYEYQYFKEGDSLEIYVEALNKTFTSTVTHVSSIPHNLETSSLSGASYYYVEISVPEEVPYGFSVTVKVPKND